MLEYEAKRNPELAMLMANAPYMTDDEINSAKVKLPWMRQVLLTLKRKNAFDSLAASVESWVVDYANPDPHGEVRRWIAGETWIKVGRTQIEIKPGQLVWFDQKGIWLDTIFSPLVDPLLMSEIHTQACGRMTRSAYMEAIRDRARSLSACAVIDIPENRDPWSAVRIYRI